MSVRTTLTLSNENYRRLRKVAVEQDKSFKDVVNDALAAGLGEDVSARPFKVNVHDFGEELVSVEKALTLAGELEDEALMRKFELGK